MTSGRSGSLRNFATSGDLEGLIQVPLDVASEPFWKQRIALPGFASDRPVAHAETVAPSEAFKYTVDELSIVLAVDLAKARALRQNARRVSG